MLVAYSPNDRGKHQGTRYAGEGVVKGEAVARRPRHPDKDLEAVLRSAEKQDWTVTKRPRGYFKMKCPCDEGHAKTVHLSPSNPKYHLQLVNQLKRSTCWREVTR